ncbi:MAG: CAF17-like 4Fe-4S cluster assembly/insertion protein YgfZ, partial [Asticcacaulis sp.]
MTKIALLSHRALIRLTGPDWAAFLKGLCTAHIERVHAEVQQGRFARLHYGAFLRPQGKMIGDVLLHAAAPDDIRLDVPLAVRDELVAKLNMYRLRAKVSIAPMDAPVFAAFDGSLSADFMDDTRGDVMGASFGMSYAPQTADADTEDWAAWRYVHGLAEGGADFGPDALYAIDANLDLLDAIDFHKGCYVGQELTSRMKRRGQIKTRVLPLNHEGCLVAGAEILAGERRAGEVLSAVHGASLGLMRLDRIDGA